MREEVCRVWGRVQGARADVGAETEDKHSSSNYCLTASHRESFPLRLWVPRPEVPHLLARPKFLPFQVTTQGGTSVHAGH